MNKFLTMNRKVKIPIPIEIINVKEWRHKMSRDTASASSFSKVAVKVKKPNWFTRPVISVRELVLGLILARVVWEIITHTHIAFSWN